MKMTQLGTAMTLIWTLLLTFSTTSYAQICGPTNCKCVYGMSGLSIECSGAVTAFDWKTIPNSAVTLTLNGFDLGSAVLPIRPLFSLKELRINNCTGVSKVLTKELAKNLPSLQLLDLTSNSLTTVPINALAMLTSLNTLDISSNQITALPSFSGISKLTDIMIDGNPLTSLTCGTFQGLQNLVMIDLSDTMLKEIPACLFAGLTSLIKLQISRSEITTFLPGTFKDLSALVYLVLNHNHLSAIPAGSFVSLKNVIELSLAGNYLTEIPDFTGLTKLAFLNLDDNLFAYIPDGAFGVMPSLKELDIRKQSLLATVSANAFTGLPGLEKLALEDCIRLETLPEDVFVPLASSLKMLFISNNGMSTIMESWLDSLPNLFWLAISNNPLICDCNLEWLITAYTTKKYAWSQGWPLDWTNANSFVTPRCYLPANLRGMMLPELKATDLKCSPPEVIPVVEQTVTLSDDGVAHLQALVKGEYPKTTWQAPGGKTVKALPWTSLLPFPWNLTVLPSPSALIPPPAFNVSDPTWWRSIIPKPFDAFLPPLIPLPDDSDSTAPKMAEATAPFVFKPPPFPFKSFIPPPFPFKDLIPSPFKDFIPPYSSSADSPKMAEAASPFPFPFESFIPPPFPFKDFIPAPFQDLIPPSFPFAQFVPTSEGSPADKPFLWVPPPGNMLAEAAAGSDPKTAPWLMFLPPTLREILPMFPNFTLKADAASAGDEPSEDLPAPWLMFIPAPFRAIIPILPNGSFPVSPPLTSQFLMQESDPSGADNGAASKLSAPWMAFVPEPFRVFIPILPNGSFPAVPSPKPITMSEAAGATPDSMVPTVPWMMFIPAPFRTLIPILPNGSFPFAGAKPAMPAGPFFPFKMEATEDGASPPAAPWMMFIPEPFRTFIPILPNGSFPFAGAKPATPAEPFFPFKMEATEDGASPPAAPWMMFIPEPFRTFIPILPNGSFPMVPPAAASPFSAFATGPGGVPKATPASVPPSIWKGFIPEPFKVFIPVLPDASFPTAALPSIAAAAAGSPFPWDSLVPEPFRLFVPILPKDGSAPKFGPDDPLLWIAPSAASHPIPVFANGSFPWPPKPAVGGSANPMLPYPLNETFDIPDFATPWLQYNPSPSTMKSFAVPTKPSTDPSDWLDIIPNPFKFFIPRLPNGSFPWPATPKTPPGMALATEARQPDGSVLASMSATEPGRYTLLVKNGAKTTAFSFDVKKASNGGKTAGVVIATIAGIAIVVLAIAAVVRRFRRNHRKRGFIHLLSDSAGQFSYSTI